MDRPSIFGLNCPADFIAKAARELHRFRFANRADDRSDHANNFAITIDCVVDWYWHRALKAHPLWRHFARVDGSPTKEYFIAISAKEGAVLDMHTHGRAAKHPTLDRKPDPQFERLTIVESALQSVPSSLRVARVAGVEDANGKVAEVTGMFYHSHMIRRGADLEEWEPRAAAVLTFWEQFDPNRGP